MSRRQIALLAGLALVASLVLALALVARRPPFVPADDDHAPTAATPCLACHGPGGVLPRTTNHPLGDDCFRCHARR